MPTGSGKSVCFQIPALLLPGVTVVISPLISLMKDQVASLQDKGISAVCITGLIKPKAMPSLLRKIESGQYKLIYIAPERLSSPEFINTAAHINVSCVCVDEAHCVSQWGLGFRPSYLAVNGFIRIYRTRPTVCALTATATQSVRGDIIRLLGLVEPKVIVTGFNRSNLFFDVRHPINRLRELLSYLAAHSDDCGIIYCATRYEVVRLYTELKRHGIKCGMYHAAMSASRRSLEQERFMSDKSTVMVATNAFGMGIDKRDIRFVINYSLPADIESYYQEVGRAGRDGEESDCIIFFDRQGVETQRCMIDDPRSYIGDSKADDARQRALRLERLDCLIEYCRGKQCYREYLLQYFGESSGGECSNCSHCIGKKDEAGFQKLPSSVYSKRLLELLTEYRSSVSGKSRLAQRLTLSDRSLQLIAERKPLSSNELRNDCLLSDSQVRKHGPKLLRAVARSITEEAQDERVD